MDDVRRLWVLPCAAAIWLTSWFIAIPGANAELMPWFANQVGNATQVISVVGVGPTDANIDVYERTGAGWQAVSAGIPAKIGEKGMSADHYDGSMMTPMGIYTLDFAFGTQPNPGGGLQYVQVTPNHWWDGDMKSPTYNLMQVCEKAQCTFNTSPSSGTENLDIPQYAHAVVMGVNKERIPGKGGAFFLHTTDGGPTAGCVAIDDAMMVKLIQWLRPGALITVSK
jgi:L,D-peptidoglycan transpeptidase YkuD (ErfK/YbiS/YcfS/YnhG family)